MTLTRRKPRILVLESMSDASRCVRAAGGTPITLSPRDINGLDEALAAPFDALLLTGGGDVDPRLYGQKPHKQVYGVSEMRDYVEWMALDRAQELDLPVMGICRGAQLIAIHNGGKLKQHVVGHRGVDHLVLPEPGSTFGKVIKDGVQRSGVFVSLHHQVIVRTGNGFRVAGRAPGGGVEAIESRDGRVLATQFHPEYDYNRNEQSRKLFDWLVATAAERAGLVKPKRAKASTRTKATKVARVDDGGRRRARQPKRSARGTAPMVTRWMCGACGIDQFDSRQDRDDHMAWVHGDPQLALDELTTIEPPIGHPDWEGAF